MNQNFMKCGLIGWAMELALSSVHDLTEKKDRRMIGRTSLLMFPIYGMGALFCPLAARLRGRSLWERGCIYTGLIFFVEYATGWLLRKFSMCPWDYSKARFNIHGLIRLDFAPAWFLLGLLFEHCTCKKETCKEADAK